MPRLKRKAYLAIKYHPDNQNRQLIEKLAFVLDQAGWSSQVIVRDLEDWGRIAFTPRELMERSLGLLSACELCVVECTEKGMGVGLETGYAHAKGIPIILLARYGSEIPTTLRGIASQIIIYNSPEELPEQIININF
jgi:nucleoside 2-deoxyribosyltransferase